VEYIPQLFENNAGVVEYIPQLLHYSITCPPKSWWTSYKNNLIYSPLLSKKTSEIFINILSK
jgi:hypothetical protein